MRPLVMGVLNVTPDSFYDGGRYGTLERAVARGLEILEEGADVVDVGGESTRPGADPVAEEEELRRVVPVVRELARHGRVSIDTMKPAVASACLEAGASLVNDVAGRLSALAASYGAGVVLMHMAGAPKTMQDDPRYGDVVAEVSAYLSAAAAQARASGVGEIYLDPGIGFGKTVEHNLALLARLDELVALGTPVLVGTSRKGFLGRIAAEPGEPPLPPGERFEASLATAVWAMAAGAAAVRVHDVRATAQAARLVEAVGASGSATPTPSSSTACAPAQARASR